MKTNVPQQKTLVRSRKGERGSALVVAIMFMVVLFAITLAAAKVRVASAKDTEDQNAQQSAYWDARSGAATVQASLLTDVPVAFNADLIRARGMAGASTLTAFDPPCYSPSCTSKPVMSPDGGRTPYPISECTSLLGNIDTWAQQRGIPLAENYATNRGYGPTRARVAVLREYTRQQMVGTSSTEPAYVLEFLIDAVASDQGRIRPSGTIMLSPSQVGCETSISLEANPTSILIGSSSSLTATYQWANTVVLKDSNGNTVDTRSGLNETATPQTINFTVSPTATITYRAEATGSGGCAAISGERTVTVTIPPPEIISFSINPSCINRGQTATLSWSVRYASNVSITGGGLNQSFSGSPAGVISGTLAVSPVADTTYTLTATGPSGSVQAQTTITVKQPFTIDSFAASTYCVTPGANVDLSWAITNAESANINGTAISSTGGTLRVNPTATTTYTLSATRSGCSGPETITRAITVSVVPVPTATFSANPARIELGQSTSLQWTTTDATSANITPSPTAGSGLSGPISVTPVPSGSLSVTPTQLGTYTYTFIASSTGCSTQQAQQTATVIVDPVAVPPPCPTINSFIADSCILPGSTATLQWNVIDFDTITITGGGINNTYLTGSGSLVVSPSSPTTYTLTAARTGCPPKSATVTVNIADVPKVNSFTASPGTINAGQSTTLQWSVSNTASVRITGTDGSTYFPGGSSLIVSPANTTTYTITATSAGCNAQQSQAQLTVNVGDCPAIDSLSANPSSIITGCSTSTITWSTSNAASVALIDTSNGATLSSAPSGSLVVNPPSTTVYRLFARSTNGTCDVERLVTVGVNAPGNPQVLSFTASPNPVNAGATLRLQWQTQNATGVSIDNGVGSALPVNGFVDIIAPAATGNYTYTLTATGGCGSPPVTGQANVTVQTNTVTNSAGFNLAANGGISCATLTANGNPLGIQCTNYTGDVAINVSNDGGGQFTIAANFATSLNQDIHAYAPTFTAYEPNPTPGGFVLCGGFFPPCLRTDIREAGVWNYPGTIAFDQNGQPYDNSGWRPTPHFDNGWPNINYSPGSATGDPTGGWYGDGVNACTGNTQCGVCQRWDITWRNPPQHNDAMTFTVNLPTARYIVLKHMYNSAVWSPGIRSDGSLDWNCAGYISWFWEFYGMPGGGDNTGNTPITVIDLQTMQVTTTLGYPSYMLP